MNDFSAIERNMTKRMKGLRDLQDKIAELKHDVATHELATYIDLYKSGFDIITGMNTAIVLMGYRASCDDDYNVHIFNCAADAEEIKE